MKTTLFGSTGTIGRRILADKWPQIEEIIVRNTSRIRGTGNQIKLSVAVLAVAAFAQGCASTGTSPALFEWNQQEGKKMNQEIQTLMQTYQRSLNEANVDLVKTVYADDAVFIGQPFPTATGKDKIVALYADFLSKLDFNVEFEILEVELSGNLGFVRTQSVGTIVPKGKAPEGSERNREVFVVKKFDGAWKFYRYIFNPEV